MLRQGGTAIAALTLLAGCGGTAHTAVPEVGGPIVSTLDNGTSCLRARPGAPHQFTLGLNVITVTGKSPATLSDVRLVSPSELTLVQAWVVPMGPGAALGDSSEFPPPRADIVAAGTGWAARTPAAGAQLEPTARYNLVLQVAGSSRYPSDKGIDVTYSAAGRTWSWKSNIGFAVHDAC